jgi:hypothetical protein
VVPDFRVVPTETGALRTILPASFDPARLAVLERDPGIAPDPNAEPGDATYRERTPERVTVDVTAAAPSILVIRTSYDDGWEAMVDGDPADVLPADGFLQGIAVPAGDHVVELTYRDEAVTTGMRAGVVAWAGLVLAGGIAWFIERRRRPPSSAIREGDDGP